MNTDWILEATADNTTNVVSFSGGKDSTATLLLALERQIEPVVVFADTGNEHPLTYEYIEYVADKLQVKINTVRANFDKDFERKIEYILRHWDEPLIRTYGGKKVERRPLTDAEIVSSVIALRPTGNPFLDLCKMKGRFPDARNRFCTQELKQLPMEEFVRPMKESGNVISWIGVRADESNKRASYDIADFYDDNHALYRPILFWSAEEVFLFLRKHGVDVNPLYKKGMSRVGCMPCIHASQREVHEIAQRFPEQIERIAEWEKEVAKTCRHPTARESGTVNFFSGKDSPSIHDKLAKIKIAVESNRIEVSDDITHDSCSAVYPVVCE